MPASRVYELLQPLDMEQILLMMAKAKREQAKKYISLYVTHLRNVRVILNGDDLRSLGIPPGPRYKIILADLLKAKLDGLVTTREDEIRFARIPGS